MLHPGRRDRVAKTLPTRCEKTRRQSSRSRSSLTTALGDAFAEGSADRGSTPRTSTTTRADESQHVNLTKMPAPSTHRCEGRVFHCHGGITGFGGAGSRREKAPAGGLGAGRNDPQLWRWVVSGGVR